MKIADSHCDTLTEYKYCQFESESAHWNLKRFRNIGGALQYMAVFTPPEFAGDSALRYAFEILGNYARQKPDEVSTLLSSGGWRDDKLNVILALEGASPIINKIENLYAFYALGVRAMTLTWNHRNFLADGVEGDSGLTAFGLECLKEMETLSMIVDVSHLNEAGFKDVCRHAEKPFMASHSNSRAIHEHPRNLHDWQIKEIIERGGFIGINLFSGFIGPETENLKERMLRHIERILSLGGERALGWGADFDGIQQCPFPDAAAYVELEPMLREQLGLEESVVEGIMYKNLVDFTLKALPGASTI